RALLPSPAQWVTVNRICVKDSYTDMEFLSDEFSEKFVPIVSFNDTRFLNPSMRYELETSWHVLIASASSIGYDWGPAACRRWNEDVFSPFRDSSRFRRQSPDCCAHRTLNVPISVLEL